MGFSKEWHNFMDEIYDFQKYHAPYSVWFRGQNVDKPLNSGLFRKPHKNIEELKAYERSLYHSFYNQGYLLHKARDWEMLFIMQHHGIKTRLLDWTESLFTALFFMSQNSTEPVLWMTNPCVFNEEILGHDHILTPPIDISYEDLLNGNKEFTSVAIHGNRIDMRHVNQHSAFILQGDKDIPIEKENNEKLIQYNVIKKIKFPLELIEELKFFLHINRVNDFTMFPDLDGLARAFNNDNKITLK